MAMSISSSQEWAVWGIEESAMGDEGRGGGDNDGRGKLMTWPSRSPVLIYSRVRGRLLVDLNLG